MGGVGSRFQPNASALRPNSTRSTHLGVGCSNPAHDLIVARASPRPGAASNLDSGLAAPRRSSARAEARPTGTRLEPKNAETLRLAGLPRWAILGSNQ